MTAAKNPATDVDVLHVTQATNAGVRHHVMDLLVGLRELGLSQALVYSPVAADDGFWQGLERAHSIGIRSFSVPMQRELSPSRDATAIWKLWRICRRERPAILHLHSSKAGGLGRLAAVCLPRVRVVYTPHASPANVAPAYALIERVLGRLRTDRMIAVSESEAAELQSLGLVAPQKIARIDNGIDLDEIRAAAGAAAQRAGEELLVVASGRLAEQKNPLLLVEAAKLLRPRFPEARWVWIGDGPLRGAMEAAIRDAGMDSHWQITGWLANPLPVLAGASVFAISSRYEGLSYSLLEAFALGLPIVATEITGVAGVIKLEESGILTPPEDASALAGGIGRVLGDPALAGRLRQGARTRALDFTRARMALSTLAVYESLRLTEAR